MSQVKTLLLAATLLGGSAVAASATDLSVILCGDARPAVCALWKQTAENSKLSPQERSQAAEMRTRFGCETE